MQSKHNAPKKIPSARKNNIHTEGVDGRFLFPRPQMEYRICWQTEASGHTHTHTLHSSHTHTTTHTHTLHSTHTHTHITLITHTHTHTHTHYTHHTHI